MVTPERHDNGLNGASILSFSLERWSHVWRGRHHIMSRLAVSNQVLFASAPYFIREAMEGMGGPDSEAAGVKRVTENLHTYIPPRWLPTLFRYPSVDRAMRKARAWQVRRAMRKLGMKRPILYIWHPSFADVVGDFDEALVVYHPYDEFGAYRAVGRESEIQDAQERALLQRADIVFAITDRVREKRLAWNDNIHVVGSGVDYSLFSTARHSDTAVPDEIARIAGPVIGYVAALPNITDVGLLLQIFRRRPDWSFVFIGLEDIPDHLMTEDLKAFRLLPNVHIIGRRPLQQIPGYLRGCDVCAIPWVINELSLSASPLKLFEYLAAGKPVVSTPLSHLLSLKDVVNFASNAEEWIDAIDSALNEDGDEPADRRQKIALENSWETKVDFISSKLAGELSKR